MDLLAVSEFEAILSPERFARYVGWAEGDRHRAAELYLLNCQLSECFYTPLHILEIALRNRIHSVASGVDLGDPTLAWFDRPEFQLGRAQRDQLDRAKRELADVGKPLHPSRILAATSFGYWTAFLGKDYDPLWHKGLFRIARRSDGRGLSRKALSEPLDRLRRLRNRIAHHEPIIAWNLPKHHQIIVEILECLSPAAAQWCQVHSRFLLVYPNDRIHLSCDPK